MSGNSKIDLIPIIKDHFGTLGAPGKPKVYAVDIGVFYGLPVLFAAATVLFDYRLRGVEGVLTALSLLVGLLLNMLLLMFDQAGKLPREQRIDSNDLRVRLLRQTNANTTYAILIGLLAVAVLAVAALSDTQSLPVWASAVAAFLVLHFVLTLLMVIKRIRAAFLAHFA